MCVVVARGPGIKPGSEWAAPATNVDISPTLLALAGITGADAPAGIDGHSFMSFILPSADEPTVPEYMRPALRDEIAQRGQAGWRQSVFVHHYQVGAGSYCGPGHHIDQADNNFIAVRHLPGSKFGNVLYSEFQWSNSTTCKHHHRCRSALLALPLTSMCRTQMAPATPTSRSRSGSSCLTSTKVRAKSRLSVLEFACAESRRPQWFRRQTRGRWITFTMR